MNYANIKYNDIANGEGVRTSLFVSGCSNHCKGCFNPETWDKNFGQKFTDDTIKDILDSLDSDYIEGLTILGGDPMEKYNQADVLKLVHALRERYKDTKSIWIYSGYTYENLINQPLAKAILDNCDILVDGKFEIDKKDIRLKFRGSSNQRIIELPRERIKDNICKLKDLEKDDIER